MTKADMLDRINGSLKRYGTDMPIKFEIPIDAGFDEIDQTIDKLPDGWRCSVTDHLHPDGRELRRATFFSPQCKRPTPIERMTVKPKKGETLEDAINRVWETLEQKYGWRVYIEGGFFKGRRIVAAWNPWQWLESQYPAFSPVELVDIIRANVREVRSVTKQLTKETAYRRGGAKGLLQRRLDDLPETVADMIRKEMKANGDDYRAAAIAVYSKALSIYRQKHPEVKGLTDAKQAVANRLKVSLSTIKRYTGQAV